MGGQIVKHASNSNGAISSLQLFSEVDKGFIILTHTGDLAGHANCQCSVGGPNSITISNTKEGAESWYQKITISSGVVKIENAGYGIGTFDAYLVACI